MLFLFGWVSGCEPYRVRLLLQRQRTVPPILSLILCFLRQGVALWEEVQGTGRNYRQSPPINKPGW